MKFSCKGFDRAGAPVSETIDAADSSEAVESLRRRGVFVSEVAEARGPGAGASSSGPLAGLRSSLGAGKRLEDVASFMRQLSLLVSTGTPLVEGLTSLEKQTPPGPFQEVLAAMRSRVEEGGQLSDAMSAHPQHFDAVCRSLVSAGEQGGKLEVMLQRLADLLRQQAKVRKTVKGAMVYPCLLICVAIVVVCAMLGFVLPRFEGLFKSLDTPLPASTKVLMSASELLRGYWWAFLSGAAVAAVSIKVWLGTSNGRVYLDRFLVTAPLGVGKAVRSFATARLARMLGTLLEGKVALLEALALTRQSMTNSLYTALIQRAEDAVTRGENVSAALSQEKERESERARDSDSSVSRSLAPSLSRSFSPLIAPSVCDALRSGERNGQMAPVLTSVARYLDEDNEVLVKALTSLLEPVILIVLGLIVGTVAISMFLPLFDLTAAAGAPAGGGGT
jgi:type II secretory pathway component PulF